MTDVISLDGKRNTKKVSKCDFCGSPAHVADFACPRIAAVTYEGDAITVELWPFEEEPPPAA